ncbi:MAG: efflux RND transporter periplasmic adaptor subunit [Flavobacteriaceae bacterium]
MKRIYIIFLVLVIFSCAKSQKEESAEAQEVIDTAITVSKTQFDGENMSLVELTKYPFNDVIHVNGMTDVPPNNKASISTFAGGYVKRTPLLIGDKVRKGQPLVTLENTDYVEIQQEYLEVAEQLNYLKSEYNRQQTLFDEKITSEKNFLKAESTYKSTLAMYNGLQKKLRMMNINPQSVEQGNITSAITIYAPIEGSVTKVNISNGTYVAPSDEIMEIVNTDHIHLELTAFEKDILKIKKGQQIRFKVPEASDSIYDAEVHLVGTSVDATDRTVKIHGHIEDESHLRFVTGMFIEAEIITASTEGFALPKDAVAEIDDAFFTLVLKEQTADGYVFDKVKLEVGKQTEDFVEVLNSDVLEDKKVLGKGTFMVLLE